MNDILAAFADQGLNPGQLELDGKIHRFEVDNKDSKKSGWYLGYQNHTRSGELFHVVVFGNYKHNEYYKYQTDKKYSPDDRKFIKEQLAKATAAREAAQRRIHEDTSQEVSDKWEKLAKFGESSYLTKKQISDCKDLGIRFDSMGCNFYVPIRDIDGKLWSVQKIQWDGQKFFFPGGKIEDCFHIIGDISSSENIIIVEGFATGASVHLSTGIPTVVAFNSGKLPSVSGILKTRFHSKRFIICGDDDRWTVRADGSPWNPGQEKAQEAAKRSLGACVFPKFKDKEKKLTDFNDLHVEEGVEEVRRQINDAINTEKNEAFVFALGFSENTYFFTSSQNKQIVAVTRFSETDFLNLMPINYWENIYPGGGAARVDWTDARSRMMSECRKKGIFQSRNVRGSGVWRDEGRTVVNMGDHLVVDGARFELGKIKSRYFYTLGINFTQLHANPLSALECQMVVEACETFKWIKPEFGILLAGGLITARVCGALPVRPHLWITGGAGEGKTTLLEKLIRPVLGSNMLYVRGATTEAGVRQLLKANAVPLLFDEFEGTGPKSVEIVQTVLDLLRASWSESDAQVVKGSAGGTAMAFQLSCSAIVSSIRTKLMNDADISRFARIELMPHGSDSEHWARLSALLDALTPDYCERLFARTVKLMPVLYANYKKIKAELSRKVSSRFGDQYGMLLAGYSILLQDEVISDAQVQVMIEKIQLVEEKIEAKVADHEDCLTHLLTKKISIEVRGERHDFSIGEAIQSAINGDADAKTGLQRLGIRVDYQFVAVATKHSELEAQVYRGERWSKSWGNALSRLPGATKGKQMWIGGQNTRPVLLPIGIFQS